MTADGSIAWAQEAVLAALYPFREARAMLIWLEKAAPLSEAETQVVHYMGMLVLKKRINEAQDKPNVESVGRYYMVSCTCNGVVFALTIPVSLN